MARITSRRMTSGAARGLDAALEREAALLGAALVVLVTLHGAAQGGAHHRAAQRTHGQTQSHVTRQRCDEEHAPSSADSRTSDTTSSVTHSKTMTFGLKLR